MSDKTFSRRSNDTYDGHLKVVSAAKSVSYNGKSARKVIQEGIDDDEKIDEDKNDLMNYEQGAADKKCFRGIKKLIRSNGFENIIVFVIPNIKTFPSKNLNDLIYLTHKYRAKYNLKLSLLIGIQSNSLDVLNTHLDMSSGLKILVKKFYFPSMKKILLEVIYRMMMTQKTCFSLGTNFLRTVAENIQVMGLSLEKFRRMLHFLIADRFYRNKLYFVNAMDDED